MLNLELMILALLLRLLLLIAFPLSLIDPCPLAINE